MHPLFAAFLDEITKQAAVDDASEPVELLFGTERDKQLTRMRRKKKLHAQPGFKPPREEDERDTLKGKKGGRTRFDDDSVGWKDQDHNVNPG